MLSSIVKWTMRTGEVAAAAARMGAEALGVPTYRKSVRKLRAELRRSRRYERPLTLLAIGTHPVGSNGGGSGAPGGLPFDPEVVSFLLLGSLLRDCTRETDIVMQVPEEKFYAVLLVESRASDARRLVARLDQEFARRTSLSVRAGAAEFPAHGYAIDDLFAKARAGMFRPVGLVESDTTLKAASND